MMHRSALCLFVSLLLFPACGPAASGGQGGSSGSPDGGGSPAADADGDTIADDDEGRAQGTDTDGDGVPDYQDTDSDGDGIPDRVEAGDSDAGTPPADSDRDGTPDAQDQDADNNGIPDSEEGSEDADGDGIPDASDTDDDNDSILDEIELGFNPARPTDTDDDGVPDYLDNDSDGDLIHDRDEGTLDYDRDGFPAYRDDDSDSDCILDIAEAGDLNLGTVPEDTDNDGRTNPNDRDADNDGLGDELEDRNCNGLTDNGETSAFDPDTDNDNVSDLIEVAAETDPHEPTDNPTANGDFVFVMPYEEAPQPATDDLDFSTSLRTVDVYLLLDRSGSMATEIQSIRADIQQVANNITCPPLGSGNPATCIPDVWWGAGTIGYSGSGGAAYSNHLSLQANPALITSSVPTSEPTGGPNETHYLALWSTVTGQGSAAASCSISSPYPGRSTCSGSAAGADGVGYPCFRKGALPLILLATDEAPSQSYVCPSSATVVTSVNNIGAKIIGIKSTSPLSDPTNDLRTLATQTGAVDANNNNAPLVVVGEGDQAAAAIENAIKLLAAGVPLDLSSEPVDNAGDSIDAVAAFIDRIEPLQEGSSQCSDGLTEADTNGDGSADGYADVLPGTPVCWRLLAKQNTTVMPTDEPQLYRASVAVYGDSTTILDSRNVFFLVPPAPLDVPIE